MIKNRKVTFAILMKEVDIEILVGGTL